MRRSRFSSLVVTTYGFWPTLKSKQARWKKRGGDRTLTFFSLSKFVWFDWSDFAIRCRGKQ